MKRFLVAAPVALALAVVAQASPAGPPATDLTCGPGTVTVPPGTYLNIVVPAGSTCYVGTGVHVLNNVIVHPTGALGLWNGDPAAPASGAQIDGNVDTDHARWFESGYAPGNTIGGNVSLVQTIGGPTDGGGGSPSNDAAFVTPANYMCRTAVGGTLQLVGSTGAFNIGQLAGQPGPAVPGNSGCAVSDSFGGSVHAVDNSAEVWVSDNGPIRMSLHADSNANIHVYRNSIGKDLACDGNTSIDGGGNSAQRKQGQCAAF